MSVDKATVRRIAHLARIAVNEDELGPLGAELNAILAFVDELSAKKAQSILREAPGVMLVDKREDGGYVTPIECIGDYATFVSRVREDSTVDNALNLWCVSDNLRKGAALNAVQIAELLGRRHLKKG